MPFGSEGLVVQWVGPVPPLAKLTFASAEIFDQVAKVAGDALPAGYPPRYTRDIREVEIFNPSMAWDIVELARWEKRHGVDPRPEVLAIFQSYIDEGFPIGMVLIQHPPVLDPSRWLACSVVLQRSIIIYEQGRQTLYLRSQIHSARDGENFVNFMPRTPIQMTFSSNGIWFPLRLTQAVQEPDSFVSIDILTPRPLEAQQIPAPFKLENRGQVQLQNGVYTINRVTATLSAKERWADLWIRP